jgi:hypothetical protein
METQLKLVVSSTTSPTHIYKLNGKFYWSDILITNKTKKLVFGDTDLETIEVHLIDTQFVVEEGRDFFIDVNSIHKNKAYFYSKIPPENKIKILASTNYELRLPPIPDFVIKTLVENQDIEISSVDIDGYNYLMNRIETFDRAINRNVQEGICTKASDSRFYKDMLLEMSELHNFLNTLGRFVILKQPTKEISDLVDFYITLPTIE